MVWSSHAVATAENPTIDEIRKDLDDIGGASRWPIPVLRTEYREEVPGPEGDVHRRLKAVDS
jgi:hypothetical protein